MKKLFLTTATLLTLAGGTYTVLANNNTNNEAELENTYEYNRDYGSRFDNEQDHSNIQTENTNSRRDGWSDDQYPEHHRDWENRDEDHRHWDRKSKENRRYEERNGFSSRKRHHQSNSHCGF